LRREDSMNPTPGITLRYGMVQGWNLSKGVTVKFPW